METGTDFIFLGSKITADGDYVHEIEKLCSLEEKLWQIEGEKVEIVRDFIFLGSKITPDGDCSHKIKICLLLEEKLWQT